LISLKEVLARVTDMKITEHRSIAKNINSRPYASGYRV
jgi:hypothetical protein